MAEINSTEIPETTLKLFNKMAAEVTRCQLHCCIHILEDGKCKSCHCQYASVRTICISCYHSGVCTAETRRNATCKHMARFNVLEQI